MALIDELAKNQNEMFEPISTGVQLDPSKQGGMPSPLGGFAPNDMDLLPESVTEGLTTLLDVIAPEEKPMYDEHGNEVYLQEAGMGSFIKPLLKLMKGSLKGVSKGSKVNTGIRKSLNQVLRPWAGPTGTYFGSGKYSDYGINFLKNISPYSKSAPQYFKGLGESAMGLGKYSLGKFGTAPNLYTLWEGLAGEPFLERSEGGAYVPNALNLIEESYIDYYSPIIKGTMNLTQQPWVIKSLQKIMDIGASDEYIDKRDKNINKMIEERFDVVDDDDNNTNLESTIRILDSEDSPKIEKKKEKKKSNIDFKNFRIR